MSEVFEIEAQARSDKGKGASRRLRRADLVPGIIYGAHQDPEMISLVHNDLIQHLEHESFYSHILTLKLEGKSEQVIMKDLQRHPAKPFITHIDFQRISATEKLKTNVPVHFVGEDQSPGMKEGGAVAHHVSGVEVSCLPKDLPEFIEVDISSMEMGDTVLMSGLVLPAGVEIPALATGAEHDLPVVSVHSGYTAADAGERMEEEEGEAEGEGEGEGEVEGGEE